ncbi:hypothetical protein CYMTET_27543 [Cymbomonas tetramitiformis]|uniref:NADP-dependent oxidoreductase domain-containing protein n=1 Tax=Cymbomonas tetramitiformis TaxID=36881 RepID=A0AAE0KWT4_9CHLO|nr:hypothetical protein CYMTET_27543 [Cymbomonas tetramitiformis]
MRFLCASLSTSVILLSGPRGLLARQLLPGVEASGLSDVLGEIAERKGASRSQVALAWCMGKGTVPIPGGRTLAQCKENVGAMKIRLSNGELDALDEAAMRIKKPMVQNSMASM